MIFISIGIRHKSDTIRAFACYLLGEQSLLFKNKLEIMQPLANDSNSGVREWAWSAIRDEFAQDLEKNIALIVPWAIDDAENIRRFASELSRPRGVWCKHIRKLRAEPWLGLDILEPLKSDPAKYVRLSVANWLNDAGKDQPEWVIDLCKKWEKESSTKETAKICKRALRNLR